jgi:outer membrane protein assembly factor BamB
MGILDGLKPDKAAELDKSSELVFVGFNSRVVALDRQTGDLVWAWKSPNGSGYTTLLLDGDLLIASVVGYTYCLDPATGTQIWANELPGMGMGPATLASVRGGFATAILSVAADEQSRNSSTNSTPSMGSISH